MRYKSIDILLKMSKSQNDLYKRYSRKILLSGVLVDPNVGFWRLLQIPSTDLKDVIGLAEAQLIRGERGWRQSLYEYPVFKYKIVFSV